MNRLIISTFFLLISLSCSSKESMKYTPDYNLTNEIAYAKGVNLSLNIPQGWFSAEDNNNAEIVLWIVKDDYSTSINFRQIHSNESTPEKNNRLQLEKLASYNKTFVRAKYGTENISFMNEEVFEFNGNIFIAYEYLTNQGIRIRTVLFKYKENYFESNAVTVTSEFEKLYSVQNSVLSSLK